MIIYFAGYFLVAVIFCISLGVVSTLAKDYDADRLVIALSVVWPITGLLFVFYTAYRLGAWIAKNGQQAQKNKKS